MSEDNIEVTHEQSQSRFVISVDGQPAGFAEYSPVADSDGNEIRDFNHTVVDSAFRGRGLSKPLISSALDSTRADGLKIRATCSAVKGFIAKNEDYADLVAK
ncbi:MULTISPECIES: GNAT family N-acetyltransferase [Corynebacterium]|uniref:GNAT family N-acetyltransferase n=1 Tax=Corynebacterium TaxID=1716 RepID=UPI0008A496EA|nr:MULTISPECIES: GNAT family N-acetyltransferase [Corynebacterium]MCX2163573.1 N-acetyltransferase [Corynebacterium auriscanis]OFT91281.1 acetyltransferase [Corynebacterium sp. HMSC28B08]